MHAHPDRLRSRRLAQQAAPVCSLGQNCRTHRRRSRNRLGRYHANSASIVDAALPILARGQREAVALRSVPRHFRQHRYCTPVGQK